MSLGLLYSSDWIMSGVGKHFPGQARSRRPNGRRRFLKACVEGFYEAAGTMTPSSVRPFPPSAGAASSARNWLMYNS